MISLREIIANSICYWLMENYDKNPAAQILAVLGTRQYVDLQKVFWSRSFRAFK